ncbi:MAG: hypothetical protein H7067_00255, partial [Burkholderiales bacterium]|nr:hypothetical protein [Opitutaceae bacterium]
MPDAPPPPPSSASAPPSLGIGHWSLVINHHGPLTQDAVVAHGRVLRALPGLTENARHRVFATFVELAQNIARYSAERAGPPGEERGSGTLTVSASADAIVLTAANWTRGFRG